MTQFDTTCIQAELGFVNRDENGKGWADKDTMLQPRGYRKRVVLFLIEANNSIGQDIHDINDT